MSETRYYERPGPDGIPNSDTSSSSAESAGLRFAGFTPEHDSDESDLDFGELELEAGQSFRLLPQPRDAEKESGRGEDGLGENGDYEGGERGRARRVSRSSASTAHSFQLYTPDEERAVVRKFDRRLVLFVAFLYMLSFLDRSNIGNARIAGLDVDLHLTSGQYAWVLTAFYVAYIVFEWMSLLWKVIPAHIYVCAIVLSWGVTASLQSCATSFGGLLVLRFLLGIGEAGFTGIPYYLSFFFKREELALRTGFFISAAPLATSFASSLAWLIIRLAQNGPIAPWRLLFLVEGFPSVVIAVVAFNVIPDGPAQAKYLTSREKNVARLRLRKERDSMTGDSQKIGLKWQDVWQALVDPKCYLTAFMFFCTNMSFSSLPVFLPTIIREMGHSVLTSQALSAPPYLISFFIVILTAWFSDRLRSRAYFIAFHALLSASGYILLAISGPLQLGAWWRYAAIYPAAIGFFSVITIIITWTINNQESESKQGAGFAILQIIGQCGPLVGTRLYPDDDGPYYVKGMGICGGAMVLVALMALGLRLYLKRQNSLLDGEYERVVDLDESHGGMLGKERPAAAASKFRYML